MTKEQAAAYVFSQSVAALARITGMAAANSQYPNDQPYQHADFERVVPDYGIGHNSVIAMFNEANES
jgi:hypothetical protein